MAHEAELVLAIYGSFDLESARAVFKNLPQNSRRKGAPIKKIGNGLVIASEYSSWVYVASVEFEESVYDQLTAFVNFTGVKLEQIGMLRQKCPDVWVQLKCIISPDQSSGVHPRFAADESLLQWAFEIGCSLIVDYLVPLSME